MSDNTLLQNLNDQQLEAIIYSDGPSIIVAGAGVGKTRVLTHKIAYLISVLRIPSEAILAVTFTNKSSREMKTRIASLIEEPGIKVNVATYHSLCAQILRKEAHNLNISNNFNIIDTDDQRKILRDIYVKEFNSKADQSEIRLIISFISQWKNFHLNKDDIIVDYSEQKEWVLRAKVYEKYQEYLELNSCLDFDDLLLLVKKIFDKFPHVLNKWQNRFQFVLVDEFQDTNDLQYSILLALVKKHHNLTVVGDPDQTIYTWRGANINLILKFTDKFPKAKTFILNQNYRSTTKILNTANSLIKNNIQRIEKDLYTKNSIGEDIVVYHAQSSAQEASWVANVIKKLIKKQHVKLNSIVVLYRNNYLSKDLEQAFINNNLNYRIIGGFKFFERKEIKDVLAYLKVIAWNDNLSMIRILNNTPKIGIKTIDNLLAQAKDHNVTLMDYFNNYHDFSKAKGSNIPLQEVIKIINSFKQDIGNLTSISNMMTELLEKTNYSKNLKDNFETDRVENVQQLLSQLVEFDSNNNHIQGSELLISFLQEISLYTDLDEENNVEAVNFMTIHSAKGLEFDIVFVIGINEGILPGVNKNILSTKDQDKLEEERRLFYVAITRAKKSLFLSSADGFSFVLNKNRFPSRFFKDLDNEHLKFINNEHHTEDFQNEYAPYKFNASFSNKKPQNKSINLSNSNSNASSINNNVKNPWKLNDIIVHEIFGKGIVTKIIGDKIQVAFHKEHGGIKILSAFHPSIKKFI